MSLPVIAVCTKKTDAEGPPDRIQDGKKEDRVENETYRNFAPPADTGTGNDDVRELVGDDDGNKYTAKKYQPFF